MGYPGAHPMPGAAVSSQTLRKLHRLATRLAGTSEDADDLVQDALVAAIEQRRGWDDGPFLAWVSGVIRHRARFLARTAGRRRRRDTNHAAESNLPPAPDAKLPAPFIDALPPSLRTIALLANAGLGRAEIAHLLDISDVALRKRISDLRRVWKESRADADLCLAELQHRPPCGLLRRSLRSTLRRLPAARCALADPDGHPIFLGSPHKVPTHGN
jgi:DNA-directed RNA polymerase specialized sigma24 family protein